MKAREIIRILGENGFQLDRQKGSHRQYEGWVAGQRRLVTISNADAEDVSDWMLIRIVRQTGLPKELFR